MMWGVKMFCKNCGQKLPDNQTVCHYCSVSKKPVDKVISEEHQNSQFKCPKCGGDNVVRVKVSYSFLYSWLLLVVFMFLGIKVSQPVLIFAIIAGCISTIWGIVEIVNDQKRWKMKCNRCNTEFKIDSVN